jgi:aconitate hydratase 2 / 2-methylisocitrate dehydratase
MVYCDYDLSMQIAGSGLVAFAAALGAMPLDMPESVLVRFTGELQPGVTLRDVVNAIPYVAMQKGLLTNDKQNKLNIVRCFTRAIDLRS